MANIEQTFNLKQHSDKHKVGCYLGVLLMVSHLTVGSLLMFNLGIWGIVIWIAIAASGFYLYNKHYSSKCIVQTTVGGFSLEVLTKSAEIDIALRQFRWIDLSTFSFFANKGKYELTLTLPNEEKIIFDTDSCEKFYDYLKARFPEKKR